MAEQFDPPPPLAAPTQMPAPPAPPAPPPMSPPLQTVAYASPGIGYYYPSSRRGRIVRATLYMIILVELAAVGTKLYELSLPPDAEVNNAGSVPIPFLAFAALLALLYLGLFITTAILFCMWMYRAHANLNVLGRDDLEYSPGWAAGAWFIPILNLFRPYQIMKEIYKASTPHGITTAAWRRTPEPVMLGLWWGAWLIGNFAIYVATTMEGNGDGDPAIHRASLYLDLAITPISMLTAWLAIRITRTIDTMQAERYAALSQYAAEQQFPPDQYPPPQA